MTGLLRCARYALAPNKLKYCGPDKNQELAAYVKNQASDGGLKKMLNDFGAMYPYLKLIAEQNEILDPFDERVVEAYWLGNELLDKVSLKSLYSHWEKKISLKERKWLELKLPSGAKPNHQFHVFNFINRTGHKVIPHTVETMDSCRISYGTVFRPQQLRRTRSFATPLDVPSGVSPDILRATFAVGRNSHLVVTDKIVYKNGKLGLEPKTKTVQSLEKGYKPGDLVTMHWGWVGEKINRTQAKNLEKYTNLALKLANMTI